MNAIQLYIGNEQVEMFDFESITLVQSIQDVRDISKIFADFSKSFSVPASSQNNKIFSHFYRPEVDGFDAGFKISASLYLNHNLFKKGKIKLESVSLHNNSPLSYKITFFGDIIKLKDVFGDDTLLSLSPLSEVSFDYTSSNILTYLNSGLDSTINNEVISGSLKVPLLTSESDKRLYYDSSSTVDGSNNLFYSAGTTQGVDYKELKPAIRLYSIVRAIEEHYSPQGINFSDDFFNTSNTAFYDLYMWLHRESEQIINPNKARASNFGSPIGKTRSSMPKFYSNYVSVGRSVGFDDTFLGSIGAGYHNYFNIEITNAPSEEYTVKLYEASRGLFLALPGLVGDRKLSTRKGTFINGDRPDFPPGDYYIEIECAQAHTFDVKWGVHHVHPATFNLGVVEGTKYAYVNGTATIGSSVNVVANEHLPDMKVIDFLTSIFKMFNLTAYVDNDDQIVVKTLDSYYEAGASWDITKYVETGNSTVESVIPYRSVSFNYEGQDTLLAKQHQEISGDGKAWGNDVYEPQNNLRFEGEAYEIEIPFEHMKFEKIIDDSTTLATDAMWGWSVDQDLNPHVGNPLVFYIVNAGSSSTEISVRTSGSTSSPIQDYHVPSNSQSLTDETSQNIHFKPEIGEYTVITTDDVEEKFFDNTLFYQYYRTYIQGVFNKRKRLFKIKAFLPQRVLLQMTTADSLTIFSQSFRINKMSTNFQTGETTFELLNIPSNRPPVDNPFNLGAQVDSTAVTADITTITADLSRRLTD